MCVAHQFWTADRRHGVSTRIAVALLVVAMHAPRNASGARPDGQLRIIVIDAQSGQQLAGRLHLKNQRGRRVRLRIPGTLAFADHLYVDGQVELPLSRGGYQFDLDTGPEYRTRSGHFEIDRHADDTTTVEMTRFADLREEGWWSGDLDVARPTPGLSLAMRAEQLDIATPISWQLPPSRSRRAEFKSEPVAIERGWLATVAGLDARTASGLLVYGLPPPQPRAIGPTSTSVMRAAAETDSATIAVSPLAWELPIWLAAGELDAVQLLHRHWGEKPSTKTPSRLGRRPEKGFLAGREAIGRWSQTIYFHVLNAGLTLPPAAGSGSGANQLPLGHNRVYVYCGRDFSYTNWWQALRAGRVFVTNGPLMRALVEGHPPGHTFVADEGQSVELEIGLTLSTRRTIEYLEIIQNGVVKNSVRLSEFAKSGGRLPRVQFSSSGWFLLRAVTNHEQKYQVAMTGPYYVHIGGEPRVSRASVQFFLDWLEEFASLAESDQAELHDARRAELDHAREFWRQRAALATAD